jgi:N-acetylhexosamine 1-kinase
MMAITKVVTDFLEGVVIDDVVVLQNGLINSTYKVSTSKGNFVLQKITAVRKSKIKST